MKTLKTIALLMAVAAVSVFAEWTGSNTEPISTRTIDGKKFYVITSPDELAWFAVQVNNGNSEINAVLENDLVFGNDTATAMSGNSWIPIGQKKETPFNGVFDGNNHTIYGLYPQQIPNGGGNYYGGFIGFAGEAAVVKDLTQKSNCQKYGDLSSLSHNSVGGVIGSVVAHNEGVVERCNNYGNVAGTKYVGGIVGYNLGIVRNSNNYGEIKAMSCRQESYYPCEVSIFSTAGGIVGYNDGIVEKSINYGNIDSYAKNNSRSGGIAGDGTGSISYCINTVVVNGSARELPYRKMELGPNAISSYAIPRDGDVSMQNDLYAYKLNTSNGTEPNNLVWSRYDGYPVFANDTLLAICKITFDDGENTNNFYTNYKGISEFPLPPTPAEGKAFAGWVNSDGENIDLTTIFLKDQTVTAEFLDWEDVVYTIRFLDEKGNVLDLQSVHSGEIPVYGGSGPTKKASVAYTYSFKGWSPEITAATWHTDYQVLFDSTLNQYKVTYLDYDGTELYSAMFDYGKKPSYSTIPKREKTVAYIYAFAGWSPTVETVSGETTYKAVYDSTLQKYEIQFMNGDESLLFEDVEYGTVPKYDGNVPTKPATKEYSYSFVGWTPEISKVTEATSYIAKFDSSLNKYMVVFQNGAKVLQSSEIEYGKVPTYKGETPQKASTAKYDYSFSSWSPALSKVIDDATYTAMFDSTIRSYEIAFVSEGETLQATELEYGALPKYEGKEPTKKESKGYTYSFKGWKPTIAAVKEKTTYTAIFDSSAKQGLVVNQHSISNFTVSVSGTQILISNVKIGSSYALFDLQGHVIAKGVVNQGAFAVNAKNSGRYIVKIGLDSKSVIVK